MYATKNFYKRDKLKSDYKCLYSKLAIFHQWCDHTGWLSVAGSTIFQLAAGTTAVHGCSVTQQLAKRYNSYK